MSGGFIHSVKVPRLYKTTAKVVQSVAEEGASLKQLIYETKHPNLPGHFALALATLKNASQLDELLRKSELLLKEKLLDPWLARVLIAELLWGKKALKSDSKPVKTILSYESELRQLLKNLDSPKLVASKQEKKPRYVRVNTLVSGVEDAIRSFVDDEWILLPKSPDYSSYLITLSRLNGSWFVQDFHIPELLAFPPGTQFHNDSRYKDGTIVLQDKASCFPAFLLKPSPGSTVLDMCAAPGMKTTHLAAMLQNKGTIFAIERDNRRYETLRKLVADSKATCVTTLRADAMKMGVQNCPNVEYILVDPSCSGSGMTDRLVFESNDSKCAPGRLRSLQSFQVFLLRHALSNFPTVKRVVYSTCSIHPEENEMVVDEVMASVGGAYKLQSIKKLLDGQWQSFSSPDYACKKKCLYARPEIDYSNGFFVAVFERNFDVPVPQFARKTATENQSNGDTENAAKSAKKALKKKRKAVKSETPETVETPTINEDEASGMKKIGKKKKKMNKQTEFEVTIEDSGERPVKKPKKEEKMADEPAAPIVAPSGKKKKSKKSKVSNGIKGR